MITLRSPVKRGAAIAVEGALRLAAPLIVAGRRSAGAIPPSSRVLLVRCDHIGDAAMATAALEPIREALQPAALDVLAGPWAAPLFRDHPLVDDVITFAAPWWLAARGATWREQLRGWGALPALIRELRSRRYDVGLDPRGDLRQVLMFLALGGCRERVSSDRTGGAALLTRCWSYVDDVHEVEKNIAVAGMVAAPDGSSPRLSPPLLTPLPADVESALDALPSHGGIVALGTRASMPSKSWSTEAAVGFVRALCDTLEVDVAYVGGPGDRAAGEAVRAAVPGRVVNLAGRCSVAESLTVLRRARVAVCVDSGPMHMAALVGTPVVALFGPTPSARYAPWTDRRVVLTGQACACRWSRCELTPDGESECLARIHPRSVVAAVVELLDGAPAALSRQVVARTVHVPQPS